jgi:hypothetical protein
MRSDRRGLAFSLLLIVSASVMAQTPGPQNEPTTDKNQRIERAKARCQQNRGVDCDTTEGLKEWLLLERSREEAVQDGSRHLPPARQNRPPPPRR